MTELSERLKDSRKAAQITQVQLADLAGISQVTIQKIESGKTQGSKKLTPIALALNVNLDWLATGRGSPGVSDTQSTYTAEDFARNSLPLGPVILTMEQAKSPEIGVAELQNIPDAPRALTRPMGPGAFAVFLEDESMRGSDKDAHATLQSWQKGDLLMFVPPQDVKPGDEVIVSIDDEPRAVIGRYRPTGPDEFEVVPLNSFFLPVKVSGNGKIVGQLKRSQRERDLF